MWKRIKIVQALINYRNKVLRSHTPRLEHIRAKLQEFDQREKSQATGAPTESELVGKINPREADVIQLMRRNLRRLGKKYNTEKAYVGWVKRFMQARGLTCLDEVKELTAVDVESFLTDLAVDGDVGQSTQDQAFYGLPPIPFGIPSPPICCWTTSIFARSRSCLGTAT